MHISRRCSGHEFINQEEAPQSCLVLLVVCRSLPSDDALTDDDDDDEDDDDDDEEEDEEEERWTTFLSLLPAELPTVE